jgi:hypothetical protein
VAGAPTSVRDGSPATPRAGPALILPAALVTGAFLIGWLIATQPEHYRPLLTVGVVSVLGITALRWPNPAVLAALLFLPLLGLVRRLLIESTGWPEADPLLLIGPALALILFAKAYLIDSRPLVTDLLSKLVLGLLALAVIGVFNPLGGEIEAGLIALMFTAVPALWFLIGRALPDRRTIEWLVYGTAVMSAAIALYGIAQTEIGFPRWDEQWLEVGGYLALNVQDEIRGFGTMASASEYAFYLGAGMVTAFAFLLHRRTWPVVVLPMIAVGILLSSIRGVMVLGFLALIVMLGLRARRPGTALPVVAAVSIVVYLVLSPVLAEISTRSGSDLVAHQLEGIARPFDPESSTLQSHLALIGEGVSEGLRHPFGQGTAFTTLATEKLGSQGQGTEFDFSNAFVSFGLPGGLLFLAIFGTAIISVGRRYVRTRDPLALCAIGVAIVTLGTWLNGAHYALVPLLWVILGWATRPDDRQEPAPRAELLDSRTVAPPRPQG